MRMILANGIELNPIMIIGGGKNINGVYRDTLDFIFPVETSLDELDTIFTETNCEVIKLYEETLNNDGSTGDVEYIHTGYTIRAGLSRTPIVTQPGVEDTEEIVENRVIVSMALRTYTEKQLSKLIQQSEIYEECLVEMANIVYAE